MLTLRGLERASRTGRGLVARAAVTRSMSVLEPPPKLTQKEYRIAVKMRRKGLPECHREFMDFMAALQHADFEDEAPAVQAALQVLEKCYEEKEKKSKRPKPSINYHLARYTKKSKMTKG
mmetsp:Transcript_20182/g.62406  ORF Transcript_20182/g.62406 Transcript_20182/m.62406 type:complete len:120 (+) Transcript_20182:71-430(+)